VSRSRSRKSSKNIEIIDEEDHEGIDKKGRGFKRIIIMKGREKHMEKPHSGNLLAWSEDTLEKANNRLKLHSMKMNYV